jgi:Kef-type K+ transport system membrane component KefB
MIVDSTQRFRRAPRAWVAVVLLLFWIALSFANRAKVSHVKYEVAVESVLIIFAVCAIVGIVLARPWGWFASLTFISGFTIVIAIQVVTHLMDSGFDRSAAFQAISFGLCCLLFYRVFEDDRVRKYFGVGFIS